MKSQVLLAEPEIQEMNTKMDDVDISKEEIMNINNKIEEHDFLQESIEILSIY
ncbi:hypothetical protein ACFQ38_12815 [Sporosarcina contaminans]|uniref:Uncharacterized protein n=1 Tax=Sporosarcina contaminans TaxID=633403 RepID=A0ABW3TZP8_9BACL